jgi:hypothetical protein
MFSRNPDGRWLTARSIELGYDPLDDRSMTGFRRPPKDAACAVDYFLAIRREEVGFFVGEMRSMIEDPEDFFNDQDTELVEWLDAPRRR